MTTSFHGKKIKLEYGTFAVLKELDIVIPQGKISTILGPNGSGKSSLLRVLARLIRPNQGTIFLDGKDIHTLPTKLVAQNLSLLPQHLSAPEGLLVEDLVWFGRHPHLTLWRRRSEEDVKAVERAIDLMEISHLKKRAMDQLSGGQKQRAWLAMVLAQEARFLFLDEPTTFLDLHFQFEILALLKKLNRESHMTILMVLHDLNMASLYSDYMFLMDQGNIVGRGAPSEVLKPELLEKVFKIKTVEIQGHPTFKPQFLFSHPLSASELY